MRNDNNEIIPVANDSDIITPELSNLTQTKQDQVTGKEIKIVTQNITLRSNDRSKKEVVDWRTALIQAESVYYPNRKKLYDVYEDIILDGHLTGIINKRIDSVLNKRLLFKKGEQPVPEIQLLLKSKVFRDIIYEIMQSKMWGISGLEFVPGEKLRFNRIPRKHIKPKWQIITINEYDIQGISYTDLANVWIVGDPEDLGLLLKCGFYALLKKGNIIDWAEYIEVFGSPIITMTYDAGDRQTELKIDELLDTIGNSTKIKLPKQAGLTVADGKASNGDGKLQETFTTTMDNSMSKVILGNTETTSSSKSSGFAQSKTHAQQQLEIIKADMVDVIDLLNSDHFLNILRSYGYPVEGGYFEYDKEIDIAYMEAKIAIDKELVAMGLPTPTEYLYETYAVDEPTDSTKLLKPATNYKPDKKDIQSPDMSDQEPITLETIQNTIKEELKAFFALAL